MPLKKGMAKMSGFKESIASLLELPEEVVLDVPKLVVTGNNNLFVENYKKISKYQENVVEIDTGLGVLRLIGKKLFIKLVNKELIRITGNVEEIVFLDIIGKA